MVRVTSVLARIPVIKFRKGGLGLSGRTPAAATAPVSAPPPTAAPKAAAAVRTYRVTVYVLLSSLIIFY